VRSLIEAVIRRVGVDAYVTEGLPGERSTVPPVAIVAQSSANEILRRRRDGNAAGRLVHTAEAA